MSIHSRAIGPTSLPDREFRKPITNSGFLPHRSLSGARRRQNIGKVRVLWLFVLRVAWKRCVTIQRPQLAVLPANSCSLATSATTAGRPSPVTDAVRASVASYKKLFMFDVL